MIIKMTNDEMLDAVRRFFKEQDADVIIPILSDMFGGDFLSGHDSVIGDCWECTPNKNYCGAFDSEFYK